VILRLLIPIGLSILLGFAVTTWLWRGGIRSVPLGILVASLAVGLGFGLSSCSVFLSLVLFDGIGRGLVVTDLAFLGGLGAVALVHAARSRPRGPAPVAGSVASGSAVTLALAGAFGLSVVAVVVRFGQMSFNYPHGWWDAWMIYNLRARFLLRGGSEWTDAFSALLPISHPDYPLLLPGLVVRGWSYMGQETTIVPQIMALGFMLATVGVLWAGLSLLRDPDQAFLAGSMLLAVPLFVDSAVFQDADTPLGFYFLTALVLLALHDRQASSGGRSRGWLVLAGLAAGLAAWTKNEGVLFLITIVMVRFVMEARAKGWRLPARDAVIFGLGALPVVLVLVYFKIQLAPANDLVVGQGLRETSARLLDMSRYGTIFGSLRETILNNGPMGVVSAIWILAIHAVAVGIDTEHPSGRVAMTALAAAGVMMAGYVMVYLTSPHDLQSHLDSSLTRLLAQVWPTALFGYFLIARTPREARG
jgi:hypothetical protein